MRPILVALLAAAMLCPAASLAAAANVPPMIQVTGGLADFQVLCRDENDRAAAQLSGVCYPLAGAIEARLLDRGAPAPDLDWADAGAAEGGRWTAALPNLPTGGPYDLEVRLLDNGKPVASTAVRHILVGDLWILAGQSNMQGVGKIAELPPPIPEVHMFSMDDRWDLAREPLHPLFESLDEAHWQGLIPKDKTREELLPGWRQAVRKPDARGVGPGLPFAWELYRLTGVPIGLIPCARGATSLDNWNPARKSEGGRSLYGAMLRRAAAAGSRVRGVVWYQGESDTGKPEASDTYLDRFCDFVAATRSDLASPDLCFLYVQLGRFIIAGPTEAGWNTVREAQRLAEARLEHAAVAPAVDCTLVDLIHLDTAGQMRLGRRLALLASREVFGHDVGRGPRLAQVAVDEKRRVLTVRFTEVNGRLRAEGRPSGFSITAQEGDALNELPIILRVDLPDDRPDTLEIHLARALPEGAQLWYGRGFDPYCNLTDDEDMGLLTFGPVPIPLPSP